MYTRAMDNNFTNQRSVSPRSTQGARPDLTYHPSPAGQPVFINPMTITTATLLHDLADPQGAPIHRSALQRWAQQLTDNNSHTRPPHATAT